MSVAAPHVMVIDARFYDDVGEELMKGAVAALEAAGATYETVVVPGALEAPAAIAMAVEAGRSPAGRPVDGFVALGCVIRGETTHYDYVCGESARGLQTLAIDHALPVSNGILTCEDREQAMDRARTDRRDKGGVAARACLDMIALKASLGSSRP